MSFSAPLVPFIERVGAAANLVGPASYKIGYRLGHSQTIICVVELPAEDVEQIVIDGLSLSSRMTPTGEVFLEASRSLTTVQSIRTISEAVDQIVARAVDADNLRAEEAGVAELRVMLARLERCVALVKEVIGANSP